MPDGYLQEDVLLGLDVLGSTTFTWDKDDRCCVWGEGKYYVKQKFGVNKIQRVERVNKEKGK